MASFSQRQGIGRKVLQVQSMDDTLRNGLWNVVYQTYNDAGYHSNRVDNFGRTTSYRGGSDPNRWLKGFCEKLMTNVTKEPLPNTGIQYSKRALLEGIRNLILTSPWYLVYDTVEFFPNNFPTSVQVNNRFRVNVNGVLEQENAGYRFVGTQLARITAEVEIQAIEETQSLGGPFDLASMHIQKALQLLSHRESPDYPNSIKESITAVEAACRVVSGHPKVTLGIALDNIEDESAHPALRAAFDKLYGWTSDASGIRHAMTGDWSVGFAEAQFMLVACSAFTNYLAGKSRPTNG